MNSPAQNQSDALQETGVTDVRRVREKIAAQYNGDLKKHVADTAAIVEPLIEKLGLKRGSPAQSEERRSGTGG